MPKRSLFNLGETTMNCCGNCAYSDVMEMSQGEVTEVRCSHPAVVTARHADECPDWIIDKNAFRPQDQQDCGVWRAKRNQVPEVSL